MGFGGSSKPAATRFQTDAAFRGPKDPAVYSGALAQSIGGQPANLSKNFVG
jgi:hypothetical protein